MNNLIVVSVASRQGDRDYDGLMMKMKDELLRYADDCRVSKSVWCFDTDQSAEEIFKYLHDLIDHRADDLFVAKLDGEWLTNGATRDDCSKKGGARPRNIFSPHPGLSDRRIHLAG